MKNLQFLFLVFLTGALFNSCKQNNKNTGLAERSEKQDSIYVVDLKAVDYAFAMPAEIPSGWITFQMENMGKEEHVAIVQPVGDSLNLEGVQKLVTRTAASGFPEGWKQNITSGYVSGIGILSPGRTAETAVFLEPGVYLMTCTIRTPGGDSHIKKGMVLPFRVTDQPGQMEKPETDIRITLSNYAMTTDKPLSAGSYTFDVQFADPGLKDVFVVRLEEGQEVEDVVEWMDDLRAPSPFDFLGGTEQQPAVFKITLEPGRYAFVSHQGAYAGLTEEILIPQNGEAPPISNEPENSPITVSMTGGEMVFTSNPGRTLVDFENKSDSSNWFFLVRLKSDFTEPQAYEFLKPAGLDPRWNESLPESIPLDYITNINLDPGESQQYNLELRKGTYFLFPGEVEHLRGDRDLSSSEIQSIKKIEVR